MNDFLLAEIGLNTFDKGVAVGALVLSASALTIWITRWTKAMDAQQERDIAHNDAVKNLITEHNDKIATMTADHHKQILETAAKSAEDRFVQSQQLQAIATGMEAIKKEMERQSK